MFLLCCAPFIYINRYNPNIFFATAQKGQRRSWLKNICTCFWTCADGRCHIGTGAAAERRRSRRFAGAHANEEGGKKTRGSREGEATEKLGQVRQVRQVTAPAVPEGFPAAAALSSPRCVDGRSTGRVLFLLLRVKNPEVLPRRFL